MNSYILLVVARAQSLPKRLRAALDADTYVLRWVSSTRQALGLGLAPSLILLDQPTSGGERCVQWLRECFAAPVVVLSHPARAVPPAADAHVVLPCTAQDLVSLIEQTLVVHSPHRVRAGEMWLDTESRRLQMNGNLYQLRPLGSRILARLMTHAGEVVPRDELFRRVWDMDDGDRTRALDVHISYLRHKLEADPRNPEIIHTERGVGYWLEPPG